MKNGGFLEEKYASFEHFGVSKKGADRTKVFAYYFKFELKLQKLVFGIRSKNYLDTLLRKTLCM